MGELLAMCSWAGMLVFSGALFIEAYGASARMTRLLLAVVAAAYLGGNVLGGRIQHECLRRVLARANVAAAASVARSFSRLVRPPRFLREALVANARVLPYPRLAANGTGGDALT
jgi:hypothetical protein